MAVLSVDDLYQPGAETRIVLSMSRSERLREAGQASCCASTTDPACTEPR